MISRRHSVFFKLHAFFALAIIVLTLLFTTALSEQKHQKYRLLAHRSMELFQTLQTLDKHTCDQQNHLLDTVGFTKVDYLAKDARIIMLPLPMQQRLKLNLLSVNIYEDTHGVTYAIQRNHCTMFYRDTLEGKTYYFVWGLFFALFGGLLTLYLVLLRNLTPLKQLYEQIQLYGEGREPIKPITNGKDEIALISNAFFESIEKQRKLKNSRELFLRNMMHELKTPITKGKLIVELENPSKNISLLDKLFVRLDHIVNQMAQIEKMHAFELEKSHVSLAKLIEEAQDNLLIEAHEISVQECEREIYVDKTLFTSALQNLIDNAHRHASSYPILIHYDGNKVCIKNHGEPLTRPISEALQAFVTQRGDGGLGLGLYIAQSVCDLHHFDLRYYYHEGIHSFCITL
jgi:two-component system OmpR family sensor kinase